MDRWRSLTTSQRATIGATLGAAFVLASVLIATTDGPFWLVVLLGVIGIAVIWVLPRTRKP